MSAKELELYPALRAFVGRWMQHIPAKRFAEFSSGARAAHEAEVERQAKERGPHWASFVLGVHQASLAAQIALIKLSCEETAKGEPGAEKTQVALAMAAARCLESGNALAANVIPAAADRPDDYALLQQMREFAISTYRAEREGPEARVAPDEEGEAETLTLFADRFEALLRQVHFERAERAAA